MGFMWFERLALSEAEGLTINGVFTGIFIDFRLSSRLLKDK